MYIHGLYEWKFKFDRAKKRFGCCNFSTKTISLSTDMVFLNSEDAVKETILHEIAHALCGHHAGHGEIWKETVMRIGGVPNRCYDSNSINSPLMQYSGECKQCGMIVQRTKKAKLACKKCKKVLEWKKNCI